MSRVLIAGTNSGCGKTTVTCALLAALRGRGVASFKCGPDYIDPMFHREALGINAHSLDPFFCRDKLNWLLSTHAGKEISIIEGVMGYYDGKKCSTDCSTYDVARTTNTPVVLVVNMKGMYNTVGAILRGFKEYQPDSNINGVIFNGISEGMYSQVAKVAENEGILPVGYLPRIPESEVPSRRLGLVTAQEIDDIQSKLEHLAAYAQAWIPNIMAIASKAPLLENHMLTSEETKANLNREFFISQNRIKIAVSRDEAFCFMYQENLELLESLGCDIVYFSPMHDSELPKDVQGLYLCGGYPELHAQMLSNNKTMLQDIRNAIESGMPTIAECGGFMYLHEKLGEHDMAGVIKGKTSETQKLQRFGYLTLTAMRDNLLCKKGESIRAHEFHYWQSDDNGTDFDSDKGACIHATETMYAGFPHLYFYANEQFARNFVSKAFRAVAWR